jgi:hypothetical protein
MFHRLHLSIQRWKVTSLVCARHVIHLPGFGPPALCGTKQLNKFPHCLQNLKRLFSINFFHKNISGIETC